MPCFNYDLSKYRLEIDPTPPYIGVCAFCGAGHISTGYVQGRSVAGFKGDDFIFKGHMCLSCLTENHLVPPEKKPESWMDGLFNPDPPFIVGGQKQVFHYSEENNVKIGVGHRFTFLLEEAAKLYKQGYSENGLSSVMKIINQERCDPPMPEIEVRHIVNYVIRQGKKTGEWVSYRYRYTFVNAPPRRPGR